MRKHIITFLIFVLLSMLLSGCQSTNIQSGKLARLDTHLSHNLRLELVEKDREILKLQKELEECNSELENQTKIATDCRNAKANEFMEMIDPIMDELNNVKQENTSLKSELEQLKATNTAEEIPADADANLPDVQ